MKINTTIIGLGKIGMGYDYSSKKESDLTVMLSITVKILN